jgi:hypothetical protein
MATRNPLSDKIVAGCVRRGHPLTRRGGTGWTELQQQLYRAGTIGLQQDAYLDPDAR